MCEKCEKPTAHQANAAVVPENIGIGTIGGVIYEDGPVFIVQLSGPLLASVLKDAPMIEARVFVALPVGTAGQFIGRLQASAELADVRAALDAAADQGHADMMAHQGKTS